MISLIWAQDKNGVIGNRETNSLPWPKIPEDFQFFKKTTWGQIVVMGRKTFESLPSGPLPGRTNIVLTSKTIDQVKTIHDVSKLREFNQDVFILGGLEVYRATLPMAKRLYRTTIDESFKGDLVIPNINYSEYKKLSTEVVHSSKGYTLNFEIFEKN